jgi:hypothetical protein
MRGRKPKPTALKLVSGNPGRRPLNEHEPEHPSIDTACPDELRDRVARQEWDRIVPALAHGHVTTVDRAILIGYSVKSYRQATCEVQPPDAASAKEPSVQFLTKQECRMWLPPEGCRPAQLTEPCGCRGRFRRRFAATSISRGVTCRSKRT